MATYYLPEARAADELASLAERWMDPRWLTRACLHQIMGKLVAHRSAVRSILDALDEHDTIDTPGDRRVDEETTANDLEEQAHLLLAESKIRAAQAKALRAQVAGDYHHDDLGEQEDARQARRDRKERIS